LSGKMSDKAERYHHRHRTYTLELRRMARPKQDIAEVLYHGLTIVNTLLQQAGRKLTRRQLADKTGLRPKQVWRYLNTLEALQFPLHREQRSQEELVWVSRDVPASQKWLRLMPFRSEELTALSFYTALSHQVADTCLHNDMAAVRNKIAGHLRHQEPPAMVQPFIDFARHVKSYGAPAVQHNLALVLAALGTSRACQVTYQPPHADHARTYLIHPYTLCEHKGGLYLLAYVPHVDAVIVQCIERLCQVTVYEDTPFARQPAIWERIAARRARAFGIIDDEDVLDVVLQFTPDQAPYVRERLWHPTQQVEVLPEGALLLRFSASGRFEIERWVLGWGDQVEVLAPLCLRRGVAAHLQAMARQYALPEGMRQDITREEDNAYC
jgi:predicted DNA-binding transcriptional regulator YafY